MLHEIARAWDQLWWAFLHIVGADNPSGVEYGFWSGWASDIGEVTLIGAVIAGYRHVNCSVKGCARIARYQYEMDGVTHKVCRHHHPKLGKAHRLTHQHLLDHAAQ